MFKINTFYDLDRQIGTGYDSISSPKDHLGDLGNLDRHSIVDPTRAKLAKLGDMLTGKFTPEESANERARILSVLERVGFDDALQAFADAVINNKYVPKELIQSGINIMSSEIAIIMEIVKNGDRMTEEDQLTVAFAMIGGEGRFRDMLKAFPETILEMPIKPDSTDVIKVSGMTLIHWMPEPLKKLAR